MNAFRCAIILVALTAGDALTVSSNSRLNVNPIRRVVTMLQKMQLQVEAQGKKEEELFEKFMCYCKNGKESLEESVESAKTKITALESAIEETEAALKQTKADLKEAKESRAAAKAAAEKATAIREKEAATFAKDSSDLKTNIAGAKKATVAIEKGMGESFLQTSGAAVLKQLSITMDLSTADRDALTAFLTQGTNEGYEPASGEIVGILKQMTDTMEADLKDTTAAEHKSVQDYEALMEAKAKEIAALTKEIEVKTARVGELGVKLVNDKEDLDDTSKGLEEDEKFLKELEKGCETKDEEHETNKKIRAQEVLAIADTIKILNDDDALDLFKKTLPTPSLLQFATTSKEMRGRALQALKKHRKRDFRLNLIALALKGKKVSFDKVLEMIHEMGELLKKEQIADDDKKEYCEKEIDETEDKIKTLERDADDLHKVIEDAKEGIAQLTDEIEALEDGIKALDKAVAEATAQRKEEHAEFMEVQTSDNAAKELINIAKNRLNKFYNPKLYKPAPKREMSEEERISVNMGGTLAPTAPPAGIAGTDVEAFSQVATAAAPPPPPETAGPYKKQAQESNGILSMLDIMVADLDKEITTTKVEEKNAQQEYEEFMKDSNDKRRTDAKAIADKEAAKAELEGKLLKDQEEHKSTLKEAMKTHEYLGEVHQDCDWLLKNFETRKEARAGEVEALGKADAVLSGADYSLLQTSAVHHHI